MVKIKKISNDKSTSDLEIVFKTNKKFPLFALTDDYVNDMLMETEDNAVDTNFVNELYDTDVDSRFKNIVNIKTNIYKYKTRLIYDKVMQNYTMTMQLDYLPLLNTANKSTILYKIDLAGKKETKHVRNNEVYEQMSFILSGGDENDVAIPEPDDSNISTDDFKLYLLNLRGIESPFNNVDVVVTYKESNRIYMLRIDKKKIFGDDTALHLHQLTPKTLNKHNMEYIGRVSDIDYVYLPIVL